MKVSDYLIAKYGNRTPTTMLYGEAKAFGISYPLKAGWLQEHGDKEITVSIAAELRRVLERAISTKDNPAKTQAAERALAALDRAWLQIKKVPEATSSEFLNSKAWKRLRYQALQRCGARCQACGATARSGAVLNVDHIKPRAIFPQLALCLDNLQVLCSDCNEGKGNWDMTDFRDSSMKSD